MTSFGFAPSDIVTGLQLCKWIYDHCFDKVNSADAKYLRFGKDVRRLDERLQQLRNAFQHAFEQSEDLDLDNGDTISRETLLRRESQDLIGDFAVTLAECREILVKDVSLQRDRAGVIQNVIWAASTQKKVDELRARIQFHTQKIYLVIEPVQLRLASNIAGDVAEILWLMREHLIPQQELTFGDIPEWLGTRFRDALTKNPPKSYMDVSQFPLKDGFDALYRHFRQSTVQFIDSETGEQTIEQYLNLLKAQWILEALKQSDPYQDARPGSLYKRIIAQVELRISKQYVRPDLIQYNSDELRTLNSTAFLIWAAEIQGLPKLLTDQNGREEKLLEISLLEPPGIRKHDLLFFRRGPTTLQIVRNTVPEDTGIASQESEKINTHVDRFIPWYAIPTSSPALQVEIFNGNETGGSTYGLKNETDIFSFQRAITGYQVVHDSRKPKMALNQQRFKYGSKLLEGTGRLQIWLWNPLLSAKPTPADPLSQSSNVRSASMSSKSQFSQDTNATVAKVMESGDRSIMSTVEDVNGDAIVAAIKPHLPTIMMYAMVEGKYTFLSLELHQGLRVVDTSCSCRKTPAACLRAVIENRLEASQGTFAVQKLAVAKDQLEHWDLSIFGRPRHPLFSDSSRVERITCRYLNLEFPSVPDREKFVRDLYVALRLRDKDDEMYKRVSQKAEFFSHKPNYPTTTERATAIPISRASSAFSENSHASNSPRVPRVPPSIERLSMAPTFSGSIGSAPPSHSRLSKSPASQGSVSCITPSIQGSSSSPISSVSTFHVAPSIAQYNSPSSFHNCMPNGRSLSGRFPSSAALLDSVFLEPGVTELSTGDHSHYTQDFSHQGF